MTIKRRKTEEVRKCPNTSIELVVWDLEMDGEVVGQAVATYKTPTQRTWDATATVDGVVARVEGAFSISKAIAEISRQLTAGTVAPAAKPAKASRKVKVAKVETVETPATEGETV